MRSGHGIIDNTQDLREDFQSLDTRRNRGHRVHYY